MTPYDSLVQHIQANGGILKAEVLVDGRWHNIPAEEGKPGNKSFSYIAFQNDDGSIGGKIKNYYIHDENGESFIFHDKNKVNNFSSLDRQKLAEERRQKQEEANKVYEAELVRGAEKASYVYKRLNKAPADHPYLAKKQINPHLAKVNQSNQLVIPMINENGQIQSLEFIADNGFKKVMTGAKSAGAFVPIGFQKGVHPEQIVIAEGFATAASIYETTGIQSVHARGRGGMKTAAEIMQRIHPDAEIILAADNDKNKPTNSGLEAVKAIQQEHPEMIIMLPPIPGDFNDLSVMKNGRERIKSMFADKHNNQYITETKALDLLSKGELDKLVRASKSDNIDLTPALISRMLEVPNDSVNTEIMKIALKDTNASVREQASKYLIKANEGAPGANYTDISITDVQTIQSDVSAFSSFAAEQTNLDKQGVDLPDNIMSIVTSWKQEIAERQEELGLSDAQITKLSLMLEKRIKENKDKDLNTPNDLKSQLIKNPKQKVADYER